MKNYSSRPFVVKKEIKSVFELLKNPRSAEYFLEKTEGKLPIKDVVLTEDSLELNTKVIGKIALQRTEAVEPNLIRYTGTHTPVPLIVTISLSEDSPERTKAQISIDADVPAFLAGMVGNQLQPALDKMADTMEMLDVDRFLGQNK